MALKLSIERTRCSGASSSELNESRQIDCYLSEGSANSSSACKALVFRSVSSLFVAPREAKTSDLTLRPNS